MIKILYIEENESYRKDVIKRLRKAGFNASGASNGYDGLIKIKDTNYDLILSGVLLSEVNGLNILEGFKIRFGSFPPPFIFISSLKDKKSIRRGMEAGADDYLPKPIVWDELLKAINVQLAKRKEILAKGENELIELKGAVDNLSNITVDKKNPKAYDYDDSVFLSTSNKSQFVYIKDIIYIRATGDYSRVFMIDNKSLLIKNSMKSWNSILPSNHFIQIRRSIIINKNSIKSIQKWFNYTHKIILKDIEEPIMMSQRYSRKLKNMFNAKKESLAEVPESIRKIK
jgi:DNA-binding LytR/AlgR family response regulator